MQGLPWERMTQFHACNKIRVDEWLINIKNYVEDTTKKQRIEKVPSMLREVESNKKCYVPLVVSIGPYHHGNPELEAVEKLKFKFANQFCLACGDQISINQLYAEVAKVADSAREYYEEGTTTCYDNESFTKMMFLDACFVLQYMYILTTIKPKEEEDQLPTMKSYLCAFVWRDLFLLENQIPLLVLEVLLKFRFGDNTKLISDFLDLFPGIRPPEKISCTNLVKEFANKSCCDAVKKFVNKSCCDAVKKFVNDHCPGGQTNDKRKLQLDASPHLLDLKWKHLAGPAKPNHKERTMDESNQWNSYRSVTELEEAGILFRASKTHCVTDVMFKESLVHGIMMLPRLVVDDTTKPLLLNLVAYEMSPNGPHDSHITSYIWLMDSLIDHANDVKELRKKGILVNNLGSDEHLATLFNEIADGLVPDLVPDLYAYAYAKGKIETYCRNKCRFWIANWMYQHFRRPWTVIAFLGAIFTLALSAGQTYLSAFPRS